MIQITSLDPAEIKIILRKFFKKFMLVYLIIIAKLSYIWYLRPLPKLTYKPPLTLSHIVIPVPKSIKYTSCNNLLESTLSLDRVKEPLNVDKLDIEEAYPLIPLVPFDLKIPQVNNKPKDSPESFIDKVIRYFIYNFKP